MHRRSKTGFTLHLLQSNRKANPKHKRKGAGFTLIELLVVIAIIGLLAGIFGISVSKWRARARDSQRVSDVRTIQQGLSFYFFRSDYSGMYPDYDIYINGSDALSLELKANGAMTAIPVDPVNSGNYQYHYCSFQTCTGQSDGATYYLEYWLETSAILGKSQGPNKAWP